MNAAFRRTWLRFQSPGTTKRPGQILCRFFVSDDSLACVIPFEPASCSIGDVCQQPEFRQLMSIPDIARCVEIAALNCIDELTQVAGRIRNGQCRTRKILYLLSPGPDLMRFVIRHQRSIRPFENATYMSHMFEAGKRRRPEAENI